MNNEKINHLTVALCSCVLVGRGFPFPLVSDIRPCTFILIHFTLSPDFLSSRALIADWTAIPDQTQPGWHTPMQMLPFPPFSSLPRGLNEMTHSLCKSRRRLVWGLKRCCSAPAAKRGNLFCSYTKIVTLSSPAGYFCLILLNLCSILDQSLLKELLVRVHESAEMDLTSPVLWFSGVWDHKEKKTKKSDKLYLVCLMRFTALSF